MTLMLHWSVYKAYIIKPIRGCYKKLNFEFKIIKYPIPTQIQILVNSLSPFYLRNFLPFLIFIESWLRLIFLQYILIIFQFKSEFVFGFFLCKWEEKFFKERNIGLLW